MSSEQLLRALSEAENRLATARGSASDPLDTFNRYVAWSNRTAAILGRLTAPSTLDALVTTPRHWALQALDPATKNPSGLASLVELEMDLRLDAFRGAREQLKAARSAFANVDLLIVPDTNVYLYGEALFDELPWVHLAERGTRIRLLVPLLVIDELDRHKRNTQPVNQSKSGTKRETVASYARRTLRKLEDLITDPTVPADLSAPSGERVQLSLHMDEPGHSRLPDPDSEIIAAAQAASDVAGAAAVIVTHDTGMHLRARAAGLRTARPPRATPTPGMD